MKLFKNLSRRDIVSGLICIVLIVAQIWLELKMPDYTRNLTTGAAAGDITMDTVRINGSKMLLCALGSLVTACLVSLLTAKTAANFTRTIREKLFDRISGFSAKEYNALNTSSLITRTTDDVMQMYLLIATGLPLLVRTPIMAVWAIAKISGASIQWTTATAAAVGVILICVGTLIAVCIPRVKLTQKLTDELNSVTGESVAGVRVIRAFNAEGFHRQRFGTVNGAMAKNSLFTGRVMGIIGPVMTLSLSGLTLAIYRIAAVMMGNAASPERAEILGNMVVFTQYAMQVVMSFMILSFIFVLLPKVTVSMKRINEVLDTELSIKYPEENVICNEKGSVEFRNVSFSYGDSPAPCLKNISFKIQNGETFGIIGATGAGKTSLVNLIPRLYDTSRGEVRIDGADVKSFPKKQLEEKVSIAAQRAILFSGDIKSNVTYGSSGEIEDNDPRLARAIDTAQADFVRESEDGIHSAVSQGGTNLSGGQRQRISIARTLFREAEIYIFDDCFSALDFRTDMLLRKALARELEGMTVIIVSQRIGTIMNADRILVLSEGEAVGLGSHSQLLENCPVYRELALSQLSEEELI